MAGADRVTRPRGLGVAGAKFWKAVCDGFDLRVDELIVLESACRTIDTVAALDSAMVDEPLTVTGSMGQLREHPLLSEARQQRAALARLLRQLDLPDVDALARSTTRSTAARTMARARWARSS